jgi:4-hydroxy-3-methylbut-2-enyl diphosphate reductase
MTSLTVGWFPFILLLTMSLLGLSYNIKLIPDFFKSIKTRRIREIPGSKTYLIAIAWGIVTSLFPAISTFNELNLSTFLVFLWSTGMVFVRTAFFDILDMQGDRIVGKETIPTLIGPQKTVSVLKTILVSLIFLMLISSYSKSFTNFGYILILCPIFIWMIITNHIKGQMNPSTLLEFLIETQFVLSGLLAVIWSILFY